MGDDDFQLRPVAYIRREVILPDGRESREQIACIEIEAEFEPCCEGIEELSHVLVLWWAHERLDERYSAKKVRPQKRSDLPLVGLFATRSPVRPNPICADVVRVIERQGRRVFVQGLDGHDGTPVLDIKGWYRAVPDEPVDQPPWFKKLVASRR